MSCSSKLRNMSVIVKTLEFATKWCEVYGWSGGPPDLSLAPEVRAVLWKLVPQGVQFDESPLYPLSLQ